MFSDVFRSRDALNCSKPLYKHSQMCSRFVQMFSDVQRCSKMFSNCHRCFWMFSRYSQTFLDVLQILIDVFGCSLDALSMFSGYFHDVRRMLSGCSSMIGRNSMNPESSIQTEFQLGVWTLLIQKSTVILPSSMVSLALVFTGHRSLFYIKDHGMLNILRAKTWPLLFSQQ